MTHTLHIRLLALADYRSHQNDQISRRKWGRSCDYQVSWLRTACSPAVPSYTAPWNRWRSPRMFGEALVFIVWENGVGHCDLDYISPF